MKVILLCDIKSLGKKNEIKEVNEGYARNFLFPKKIAVMANAAAIGQVQAQIVKAKKDEAEYIEKLKKLALKLEKSIFIFKVKTKNGKLFGSVDKKQIAQKIVDLAKIEEIDLSLRFNELVKLEKPIKELSESLVEVNLGKGVTAKVKVNIEEV